MREAEVHRQRQDRDEGVWKGEVETKGTRLGEWRDREGTYRLGGDGRTERDRKGRLLERRGLETDTKRRTQKRWDCQRQEMTSDTEGR